MPRNPACDLAANDSIQRTAAVGQTGRGGLRTGAEALYCRDVRTVHRIDVVTGQFYSNRHSNCLGRPTPFLIRLVEWADHVSGCDFDIQTSLNTGRTSNPLSTRSQSVVRRGVRERPTTLLYPRPKRLTGGVVLLSDDTSYQVTLHARAPTRGNVRNGPLRWMPFPRGPKVS
jgi:hypothetical protein